MKPYFTKYFPVEGIINKFSWAIPPNGKTMQLGDNPIPDDLENKGWRLAKLFLCSRNIQVGDLAIYKGHLPTNSFRWNSYHESNCEKDAHYKVIGEISSEALEFVKEGMEFDENEVRFKIMNGYFLASIENTFEKAISHGYYEAHKEECNILVQVKCPCCKSFK